MEFERNRNPAAGGEPDYGGTLSEGSSYRISSRPLIHSAGGTNAAIAAADLPRSYGTQTLCLMARDPHSLFAYWDIDWNTALREKHPRERKVHLRILNTNGAEQSAVEIQPMAGSCFVTVSEADAAYCAEIGYFDPPRVWNSLARSEIATTAPDRLLPGAGTDFATVPFHLTFQQMIDALRISKPENESLTAMLRDLRTRAAAPETDGGLTLQQRELARVLEDSPQFRPAEADFPSGDPAMGWTQQRLERILGLGLSSPGGGFGGSSRSS